MSRWVASRLGLGKARRIDDARGRYVEFCKNTFPNELDLRGMKIARIVLTARLWWRRSVFHELGRTVLVGGAERDEHQRQVGATSPVHPRRRVLKAAPIWVSPLDGDGTGS